jgi:putrescine transport system substrate-binding protein
LSGRAVSDLAAALIAAARAVPLAACLAVCLTACARPAPTASTAAEEPVLHIYNWDDYIAPGTVAAFERATGIKVVYDVFDSNETLESKLMVGDSGYDLVSTSMAWYSRQIRAGLYEPLDKSQLPNWKNLDPEVLAVQAQADPGNRYAAPYLHAMNGFAYNRDMVRARMADAPVDSLDMLFKPTVVARFADCGVSFLDSPDDVLELALKYLGLDPNSRRPGDLQAAEQLVLAVRPHIRLFDSNDYVYQLASGELCVTMGWSSDYSLAMIRSRAAGLDLHLAFTVPREGSNITYNAFLIPAGAPHPQAAHRFINFLLEPNVIADITNYTHYGNDNLAARPLVHQEILDDPAIYPPPAVRARLYLPAEFDVSYQRLKTRTWTRIKNGL